MTISNPIPKLSRMEQLPCELKLAILAAVPDLVSLKSAALASPALFDTFRANEEQLSRAILLKRLDPALIHDALAVLESSRTPNTDWTEEQAVNFLANYTSRQDAFPLRSWKLSDLLPLGKFHDCVRYFVSDFVSKAFGKGKQSSSNQDDDLAEPMPLSKAESIRIERAFYRFEIYCNMFGDHDNISENHLLPDCSQQRNLFFEKMSPWEGEQLACVHDYLRGAYGAVFDKLVQSERTWLEFAIESGRYEFNDQFLQHQLSRGLTRLCRLIGALPRQNEDEQFLKKPELNLNGSFLNQGLEFASTTLEAGWVLSEYDEAEEKAEINRPLAPDPDRGPEDVWRWAHQNEGRWRWINSYAQTPLRDWGYVMWDRARLDKKHVFDSPWVGPSFDELNQAQNEKQINRFRIFQERLEKLDEPERRATEIDLTADWRQKLTLLKAQWTHDSSRFNRIMRQNPAASCD